MWTDFLFPVDSSTAAIPTGMLVRGWIVETLELIRSSTLTYLLTGVTAHLTEHRHNHVEVS